MRSTAWVTSSALVAHHHYGFLGAEWRAGAQDLFHERAATSAVEDLSQARFQARAFTGGEDDDG